MSNISCADFGRVTTEDVSAKTVARCEMKAGACLIASARIFYQVMLQQLSDKQNVGCSICLHAYRQDATNGKRKVSAMELDSAYVCCVTEKEAKVLSWKHFHKMKRLADLVPVKNECGPGCVGVTMRGFRSLGCPNWRELEAASTSCTEWLGCDVGPGTDA